VEGARQSWRHAVPVVAESVAAMVVHKDATKIAALQRGETPIFR